MGTVRLPLTPKHAQPRLPPKYTLLLDGISIERKLQIVYCVSLVVLLKVCVHSRITKNGNRTHVCAVTMARTIFCCNSANEQIRSPIHGFTTGRLWRLGKHASCESCRYRVWCARRCCDTIGQFLSVLELALSRANTCSNRCRLLDQYVISWQTFALRVGFECHSCLQAQYTRGSIIPLSMLICSQDVQTMDLVSTPDAIAFHLVCITDYVLGRKGKWTNCDMVANASATNGDPVYREIVLIQSAVWRRAAATTTTDQHTPRQLFGELHLRSDLVPPVNTPDITGSRE